MNIDYYGRFDVSFSILEPFLINEPDPDGDGLFSIDEINGTFGYITDPFNPDTDGDGVNDRDEISFGFDPTDDSDFPSLSSLELPEFRFVESADGVRD